MGQAISHKGYLEISKETQKVARRQCKSRHMVTPSRGDWTSSLSLVLLLWGVLVTPRKMPLYQRAQGLVLSIHPNPF